MQNGTANAPPPTAMLDVMDVIERERMRAYDNVDMIRGGSFNDSSTVMIVPTLGKIHWRVTESWDNLAIPMNGKRVKRYAVGEEVGRAYNALVKWAIEHPVFSKWKYLMTIEDDNVLPPDAHVKLIETIEYGPFDAVGGLYWTKGDINMPMAYGDPKEYARSGVMDFRPRDVVRALEFGNIMEVNGIGMGCSLWRMDLFREFEPPWFVTVMETVPSGGMTCATQDLYFCERMRKASKRIAVDLRVHVGHIDPDTGVIY